MKLSDEAFAYQQSLYNREFANIARQNKYPVKADETVRKLAEAKVQSIVEAYKMDGKNIDEEDFEEVIGEIKHLVKHNLQAMHGSSGYFEPQYERIVADSAYDLDLARKRMVMENKIKPMHSESPSVVQHFHAPVASIQTGNQNVANVQQNFGANLEDILKLLRELEDHLPDENKQHGLELIEGLEAEVKSEKPSESRMKLYPKGLGEIVKETGKTLIIEVGKKMISGEISLG